MRCCSVLPVADCKCWSVANELSKSPPASSNSQLLPNKNYLHSPRAFPYFPSLFSFCFNFLILLEIIENVSYNPNAMPSSQFLNLLLIACFYFVFPFCFFFFLFNDFGKSSEIKKKKGNNFKTWKENWGWTSKNGNNKKNLKRIAWWIFSCTGCARCRLWHW